METLKRRAFLASAAITVPALGSGCLASVTNEYETEGHDDEPIERDPQELILEEDEINGEGWELAREEDYGTNFYRDFSRDEETIRIGVEIYDSVEEATAGLESSSEFHEWNESEAETEAHDIASAGFFQEEPVFGLVFRDANARGAVTHLSEDGERNLVFDTAVTMHETWR